MGGVGVGEVEGRPCTVGSQQIWSINYNNACNDVAHLIMLINLQAMQVAVAYAAATVAASAVASCRCTLPRCHVAPLQAAFGHKS